MESLNPQILGCGIFFEQLYGRESVACGNFDAYYCIQEFRNVADSCIEKNVLCMESLKPTIHRDLEVLVTANHTGEGTLQFNLL